MKHPFLLGKIEIKKTLSRSQTQISKGVKIATKRCSSHAFGFSERLAKTKKHHGFSKKRTSLPNKSPNEF